MTDLNFSDLANTISAHMAPQNVIIDGDSLMLVPNGMKAVSLKPFIDEQKLHPDLRKGTANHQRLQSLIDHANRFKGEASVLFAKAEVAKTSITASIQSIFDYHPAGSDLAKADNLKHRGLYEFPIAKDFVFWLEHNGDLMAQDEFALFLEEHVIEMASPTDEDKALVTGLSPRFAEPIDILSLSRDLEIYSKDMVKQALKLSSGERELKFSTEHCDADGKPVAIPDFFVVQMPLFDGGESHRILARLRYRKAGERLVWAYDLYRIDRTLEEAFQVACSAVQTETALPLFYGTPE